MKQQMSLQVDQFFLQFRHLLPQGRDFSLGFVELLLQRLALYLHFGAANEKLDLVLSFLTTLYMSSHR